MNRIKEVIKEKGLTITSLADKLGIARESLSRMIVSPSYPTLEKISTALDVPMWQLFASPEEVKGEEENTITCPHCGKKIHFDGEPRMPIHKNIRGKEYYQTEKPER